MPRLPKGMFKRENSFCVRIHRGGQDTWRTLGSDYPEACKKLRRIRAEGVTSLTNVTVTQAVQQWLETYVRNARCAYNQGQSERRMKRYFLKFMGPMELSRVGKEDLRRYRVWLQEKHSISLNTVKHLLSDARCFFNWCVDVDLIDRSPVPRRLMPRIQERPPDRLDDGEVDRLVAIPEPYRFVVRLALETGLRWGELTRAQSTDVERLASGAVLVVHQTKSGKMRRVPLSDELQRELRLRVGRLVPFASPGQFNERVKRLSGVKGFHVHRLRHTFACRWIERGGSLAALQQLLGHSDVRVTQRYARISDDLVASEFRRLETVTVAGTVASASKQAEA